MHVLIQVFPVNSNINVTERSVPFLNSVNPTIHLFLQAKCYALT